MSNKKGVSDVIATVMLILLVIVAIGILAGVLKGFIGENKEVTEAKVVLLREDIRINSVQTQNLNNIKVALTRYTQNDIETNISNYNRTLSITIQEKAKIDAVSVIDVSSSMMNCRGDPSLPSSNPASTGGVYDCCVTPGKEFCKNSSLCTSCNGIWTPKLEEAQNALKQFTDILIPNSETDNKIGISGYHNRIAKENYLPLSSNPTSIRDKVDTLNISRGSCICCGILNATASFSSSSSDRLKFIILLSDGRPSPNGNCSTRVGRSVGDLDGNGSANDHEDYAIKDAFDAACSAQATYKINISTVAFGINANDPVLKNISECGKGSFYNVDQIENVGNLYNQIASLLSQLTVAKEVNQSKVVENEPRNINYILLIFYNDTNVYREKIEDISFNLLKRTYTFNLEGKISNINKIEAYPVILTSDNKEILGTKFGTWPEQSVI